MGCGDRLETNSDESNGGFCKLQIVVKIFLHVLHGRGNSGIIYYKQGRNKNGAENNAI